MHLSACQRYNLTLEEEYPGSQRWLPLLPRTPQMGNTRSRPEHGHESSSSDDSIGQRCGRIKRCHSTRLSMGKLSLKNYFMSISSVVSPVDHLIYQERSGDRDAVSNDSV